MVFRTRDMLVRQRTQTINALRGHLAEFGLVVAQGLAHVVKLNCGRAGPRAASPGSGASHPLRPGRYAGLAGSTHKASGHRNCSKREGRRNSTSPHDHTRGESGDRDGCGGTGAAGRNFQTRPRLCGLARAHAIATLHRRKAESRRDIEDGRPNTSTSCISLRLTNMGG